MIHKRKSHADNLLSEINVTPLVDVMLVLLVLLMAAVPLINTQSIQIALPKTVQVAPVDYLDRLVLIIDKNGVLHVHDRIYTQSELYELLISKIKSGQSEIEIKADEAVGYGTVAEVMAIAQKSGMIKIIFTTIVE